MAHRSPTKIDELAAEFGVNKGPNLPCGPMAHGRLGLLNRRFKTTISRKVISGKVFNSKYSGIYDAESLISHGP
jgi:hypothetical protein